MQYCRFASYPGTSMLKTSVPMCPCLGQRNMGVSSPITIFFRNLPVRLMARSENEFIPNQFYRTTIRPPYKSLALQGLQMATDTINRSILEISGRFSQRRISLVLTGKRDVKIIYALLCNSKIVHYSTPVHTLMRCSMNRLYLWIMQILNKRSKHDKNSRRTLIKKYLKRPTK